MPPRDSHLSYWEALALRLRCKSLQFLRESAIGGIFCLPFWQVIYSIDYANRPFPPRIPIPRGFENILIILCEFNHTKNRYAVRVLDRD